MSDPQGTGQENTGAGDQQVVDGQQVPDGKDGAQRAGENTPADGADKTGADKTADVEYAFTAPEGVEFDKARLDEFTAIAKELKLPKDAAEKFVGLEVKRVQEAAAAHTKLVEGWAESVKTDKEIGGEKLTENLAIAKKAIDLGPPELKELLNTTGLGNHPAVVKWALTVGKKLSEDSFVQGGRQSSNTGNSEAERANRLYPTTAAAN